MTTKYSTDQNRFAALARRLRFSKRRSGIVCAIVLVGAIAGTTIWNLETPRTILAFGDSYFSGYGVDPEESFPSRLEAALHQHGYRARVLNLGVPGETIADGLERLDDALARKPDLIILEFGANDAEQGLDPVVSRKNLDRMLAKIRAAHVHVLLCGTTAPAEMGQAYQARFDPIFTALARKHRVPLYPDVLDGVAADSDLIQDDGEHPNPRGVQVMVDRMLPAVEGIFR
jgi:acyl-CoA thioesterase-1